MADNSWFTVFTTLLGTLSGAGLTYLSNAFSENRRIKFDDAKENRAEQKRLNKKEILLIKKISKYSNLMLEFQDHFNKPIVETPHGYAKALFDIKAINIPHKEIIISDDDIYDIFKISGEKALNAVDILDDKINSIVSAVDLYNQRYSVFVEELKKQSLTSISRAFLNDNSNLIYEIVNIAKAIADGSKKNIEDIKNFLSIFINGNNFYEKDIEIMLPKADGSFEIIERTVP